MTAGALLLVELLSLLSKCRSQLGALLLAFVVAFTRSALLGWLLLGVEIIAVVAVRSSFIGATNSGGYIT